MIHDLSRVLCAQLTHRRTIDPMSMGHRVRPFWIERVDFPANASTNGECPSAQAGVSKDKDSSQ